MTAEKARVLARVLVGLGILTLIGAGYYFAAQSISLPGSEALRDRWHSETRYRGTSGHRSHNARDAGPIEMGRLAMLAGAFGLGALSMRRKAKVQSPG